MLCWKGVVVWDGWKNKKKRLSGKISGLYILHLLPVIVRVCAWCCGADDIPSGHQGWDLMTLVLTPSSPPPVWRIYCCPSVPAAPSYLHLATVPQSTSAAAAPHTVVPPVLCPGMVSSKTTPSWAWEGQKTGVNPACLGPTPCWLALQPMGHFGGSFFTSSVKYLL